MSKKLKAAIMAGTVKVQSTQSGQVSVWYRDREGNRKTVLVSGFSVVELAPKLTSAELLPWSNIEQLTKQGAIRVL